MGNSIEESIDKKLPYRQHPFGMVRWHDEPVKGFKAFSPLFEGYAGFKFEVGKTYKLNHKPMLCQCGFHFNEHPIDTLDMKGILSQRRRIRFAHVEGKGTWVSHNKCCSQELTILQEISLDTMIRLVLSQQKKEYQVSNLYAEYPENIEKEQIENLVDLSIEDKLHYFTYRNRDVSKPQHQKGGVLYSFTTDCMVTVASKREHIISESHNSFAIGASDNTYVQAKGIGSIASATGYSYVECTNNMSIATVGHTGVAKVSGHNSVAVSVSTNSEVVAERATSRIRPNIAVAWGSQGMAVAAENQIAVASTCSMARGAIGAWLVLCEANDNARCYGAKLGRLKVVARRVDGKKIKADTDYYLYKGKVMRADGTYEVSYDGLK